VRLIQAFGQVVGCRGQIGSDLLGDVILVIAGGKGWMFDDIFAEVTRLGLEGRVKLTGFVDEPDLPALYSAATVYAYVSLYEGFGLPVLEAMACGAPVVGSSASSIPEVVGDAGLLVDPTDVDAIAAGLIGLLRTRRRAIANMRDACGAPRSLPGPRAPTAVDLRRDGRAVLSLKTILPLRVLVSVQPEPQSAQSATQKFAPNRCGGDMNFDAARGMLSCPFCGHTMPTPETSQVVQEHDLAGAGRHIRQAHGFGTPGPLVQMLPAARRTTSIRTSRRRCAFCGSNQVLSSRA
jgi:hypothetical protein